MSGILSEFDRDIAALAFSSLVEGNWRNPKSSAQEALAAQSEILREAGANFSDGGNFKLELARDYVISGSLEIDIVERGSARAKVIFKLRIGDRVIGRAILAMLIAGGLLAPSSPPTQIPRQDAPFIVCSIGHAFQGNWDVIVKDGVEDLVDRPGEQDVRGSAKWKARQACLYHAGADPGEFDGVRGRNTLLAERQFTDLHKVEVDWGSRIFVRFLLEKANERMQRDPTYRAIPRE